MTSFARTVLLALCMSISFLLPAAAAEIAKPEGPVILRVTGSGAAANVGDTVAFDLDMLRDLESRTIQTSTIWTDGDQEFIGISLSTLIDLLTLEGSHLRARAINDYAVDIPMEDALSGDAMIAYARNGKPMSVRDKGPLWIIYPYDSDPRFQAEVYYARSIWQLDRIEVID